MLLKCAHYMHAHCSPWFSGKGISAAAQQDSSTRATCVARVGRVASMQTFLTKRMPMRKGADTGDIWRHEN